MEKNKRNLFDSDENMKESLKEMFELQKELDEKIGGNPSLSDKLYALLVELGEVMAIMPYKWWKKGQKLNINKVVDELVDCLHFAISCDISEYGACNYSEIINSYKWYKKYYGTDVDYKFILKLVIKESILKDSIYRTALIMFLSDFLIGYNWFYIIYEKYIGKNALNYIRNKYGYGSRDYPLKNSKYDNKVLNEVMNELYNINFKNVVNSLEFKISEINKS